MKRVLTALILAPAVVAVIFWGPPLLFLSVLSLVALLCYHEYADIAAEYGIDRPGPLGYAAGLVLLLASNQPVLAITLIALLLLVMSMRVTDLPKSLPGAAFVLFGIIYIFGCWHTAILLRARSPHWLLFALAVNWIGDSAAYYTGRAFGKHKLAPRISPGKSWEGSIGSIIAAVIFAVLYLPRLVPGVGIGEAILLGAAGNVAGQLGDLAESALKRGAGVKDSGHMLPGHGGWLDRVDSALFAMPVILGLLSLF